MKRSFLLLLVVSLHVTDAYGVCPNDMTQCNGSSLDVVANCCAKCDGNTHVAGTYPAPCAQATDDTCSINQALDAVGQGAGGGEVIIPPGSCIISLGPDTVPLGASSGNLHLYSNLTIRGTGPKSVLKVSSTSATNGYGRIFWGQYLNNVVFKDFRIDQNPDPTCIPPTNGNRNVIAPSDPVQGITVSGMYFDPTDTPNTIFLVHKVASVQDPQSTGDIDATVTNNFFNFYKCPNPNPDPRPLPFGGWYDVSTVLIEGSQQVISNNTFTSPSVAHLAHAAIETLGGRSVISDNTFNNYSVAVLLVPSYYTCGDPIQDPNCATQLNPSDVVIASNSATCAASAIQIWPTSGTTLQNVSITGNSLQICNKDRHTVGGIAIPSNGIATVWSPDVIQGGARGYQGNVDGLTISNNLITMQKEDFAHSIGSDYTNTGGILLRQVGNLRNILVKGNTIKDAPMSGIRVGPDDASPPSIPQHTVQRLRIVDNIIADAGNNNTVPDVWRHAIGLLDYASDVQVMQNIIHDTGSSVPFGKYALYLQPGSPWTSTNVRTGRNTVRVSVPPTTAGLLSTGQTVGLVDSTSASDVVVSQVSGATTALAVDFMSFTQYITTINTTNGQLTVQSPQGDQTTVQWTVGQLVTFRFLCGPGSGGCTVGFASPYAGVCEADCSSTPSANMAIANGTGRAITFQVEKWPTETGAHKFFELYRSPTGGVPNP